MNKIERLIQELCPEGVPFRDLGSQVQNLDSKRKPISQGAREPGEFPYYGANGIQDWVSGFLFDGTFLLVGEDGSVKTSDGAPVLNWAQGKIWVNNHAHVLKEIPGGLNLRFLYFYLATFQISEHVTGGSQMKITQNNLNRIPVPTPPLEVQNEIVSILDKFTELEAELEAELHARRKQYEQYRIKLLSTHLPTGVEFQTLRELLGPITRGKRLTKSNLAEVGSIPVFHGGLNPIGYHDKSNSPGQTVMIINTGASSGTVGWSKIPFWCSDGCFALPHSKEFSSRYIYHYASLNEKFFMDKVRKAGIPTLAPESILSLPIPVLPMAEQMEIVRILDSFLDLVSKHSMGLPFEIQARRKQYEYYRNKLLTFKEFDAA